MVARLPEFVLNQIVTLHAAGWSAEGIRKVLCIGRGTVFNLLKMLNEHSEFFPCTGAKRGRPRALDDECEVVGRRMRGRKG
jgi:transposase